MLREDQIQRYSRQILLREVGGRGQERLLSHVVEFAALDPTLSVAAAYLAAGGSPLLLPAGAKLDGFLTGTRLDAFAPDAAAASGPPWALVGPLSSQSDVGPPVRVVVGPADVAFLAPGGCAVCFDRALSSFQSGDLSAHSVALGSLTALLVQRLALGLTEPPVGHLRLDAQGLHHQPLACPAHPSETLFQ